MIKLYHGSATAQSVKAHSRAISKAAIASRSGAEREKSERETIKTPESSSNML